MYHTEIIKLIGVWYIISYDKYGVIKIVQDTSTPMYILYNQIIS